MKIKDFIEEYRPLQSSHPVIHYTYEWWRGFNDYLLDRSEIKIIPREHIFAAVNNSFFVVTRKPASDLIFLIASEEESSGDDFGAYSISDLFSRYVDKLVLYPISEDEHDLCRLISRTDIDDSEIERLYGEYCFLVESMAINEAETAVNKLSRKDAIDLIKGPIKELENKAPKLDHEGAVAIWKIFGINNDPSPKAEAARKEMVLIFNGTSKLRFISQLYSIARE